MAQPHSNLELEFRPLANFAPTIWENYFDVFSPNPMEKETYSTVVDTLKGELKEILVTSNPLECIKIIDLLTHLGVSYHFEEEIEEQLKQFFNIYKLIVNEIASDLSRMALVFRVFRQNGYYLPSDVFNNFKDNNGKFKEELAQDLKGILSLYEATHLRTHGEEILDEALEFTTVHLKRLTNQSSHQLAKKILHSLDYPIHLCVPRVEARRFISIYEEDEDHNDLLIKFAKNDFNLLQLLHREEISQISIWKKELATKLTYARDRAIEMYFWMSSLYFEPKFSTARIMVTKVLIICSYLNDTYDAYGTPAELEKLTIAIKRWNMSALKDLPDNMKFLYKTLLDTFYEFDQDMSKEGRSHIVNYAKEQVIALVCAYNQEAEWCKTNYVPKFEEYMKNALMSAGSIQVISSSFIGMRDMAGKEAIEWMSSNPKIMEASNIIGRLLDDIRSHKFEKERGHCVSSVECYMEEHGIGEVEAIKELKKIVENAWKDTNEECMRPTAISKHVILRVLNFNRSLELIYKQTDGYTNPEVLKDIIATLYVHKIPI